MIYGQSGSDTLDADRVVDLLDALEKFQNVDGASGKDSESAGDDAVRGALRFAFSPEGRNLRELIVDEVVNSVDIVLRDTLHQSLQGQQSSPSDGLLRGLVPALVPAVKDADRQKLETQQQILSYLAGGSLNDDSTSELLSNLLSPDRPETREKLQKLVPLVAENQEELQLFAFRVTQRLVERQAKRSFSWLSERLDGPVQA